MGRDDGGQTIAARLFERGAQAPHGELQGCLPIDGLPFAVMPDHRRGQPVRTVEALVGEPVLVGQPAFVDRFVLERQHAHHLVLGDLDNEIAAERIVRRYGFAPFELPGARLVTERFRGECADRAHIDHVARKLGGHRVTQEGHDFGVLAAASHPQLHHPGNLDSEAHATRAVDAAGHLFAGDQRPERFVEHHALGLGIARVGGAVTYRQILQLAFAALVANGAVERVIDQQELHHPFLRVDRLLRMGPDFHSLADGRGARGKRLGRLLDLHEAHPAVGRDGKLLVPTEVRHIDAELVRSIHDGAAGGHFDLLAVDFEIHQHCASIRGKPAPGTAGDRCDAGIHPGSA